MKMDEERRQDFLIDASDPVDLEWIDSGSILFSDDTITMMFSFHPSAVVRRSFVCRSRH
jgi:hypothetical protein